MGAGKLTVTNSTFSANSASSDGGAIAFWKGLRLTVTDSTFSGNSAVSGGALAYDIVAIVGGPPTVTNSTFSGNSASASGGAIWTRGTKLTVTNSTFSSNTASDGGALFNLYGSESYEKVTNSTFSGNSASGDGGAIDNEAACGKTGTAPCAARLTNTILANNGPNCTSAPGFIIDGGHNLDDGTTCGFSAKRSLNNTNPMLDPTGLADNGGATQTIAVESGSPAINVARCVAKTDQRGYMRPGTGATLCTIGAYEYNSPGCPTRLTACGPMNICSDLGKDPNNCGTCGNVCKAGQRCSQGGCR